MSERVYLKGRVKYARRLFEQDEYAGKQFWSILFYPEKVQDLYDMQLEGVKNTIKKDEDGYCTTYRRYTEKVMKNEKILFKPPVVTGPNNEPVTDHRTIPQGAQAIVTLEKYEHPTPSGKRAKAVRLEAVQFLELQEVPDATLAEEPSF